MRNLVPEFILKKYKMKEDKGFFRGFVLFIDISGFTKMTQDLMKNGKEGAEILSDVINNVFTPSIDIVHKYNGFISIFGGDAFNAIFPETKKTKKDVLNSLKAAKEIQNVFNKIGSQKTKFGVYNLKVKIGASYGKIDWGIVNSEYKNAYYFKGVAINKSANCEKFCNTGDIVIEESFEKKINLYKEIIIKNIDKKYYKLYEFKYENIDYKKKKKVNSLLDQKKFYPENVLKLDVKGEFRDVISVFISFQEKGKYFESISKVLSLVQQYGGYFNRISFGDKGGFLLILFGAPLSKEKLHQRAAEFAFKVIGLKGFTCRIGMTYGRAFTGFTGSHIRAEYTAQGRSVNLAARFMSKSNFKEIYLDDNIYEKLKNFYKCELLENGKFKGFKRLIPYYKLIEKRDETIKVEEGIFVGREKELQKLIKYLEPLKKGKFGGIVYIDGEAGIGKSRLVQELKKKLSDE